MIRRWTWAPLLLAGLVTTACGDEDPVGIGQELVPGGLVRTVELVLDAPAFLVSDTTLTGFSSPAAAGFLKVALDAEGGVDARALARFGPPPSLLNVRVSADSVAVDSMLSVASGRLLLRLDTVASTTPGPVLLRLLRVEESWHPASATWTERVDTLGLPEPWSTPGAGGGMVVDSAVWEPGTDSVTFVVDSATAAQWTDTTTVTRGAVILAETPGTDLVSSGVSLRLDMRPSVRPDTLVPATVTTLASTFIYQPAPGPTSELRVGGLPAWRAYLDFGATLDTLRVPCASGTPGCTVPLREASVSFASLLLQPVDGEAGFAPERGLVLEARPVLGGAEVPLLRSPLGATVGRVTVERDSLAPDAGRVELPITFFLVDLVEQGVDDDTGAEPPTRLAVAQLPETASFGFATFSSRTGPASPRLRLVVTVASPLEIR